MSEYLRKQRLEINDHNFNSWVERQFETKYAKAIWQVLKKRNPEKTIKFSKAIGTYWFREKVVKKIVGLLRYNLEDKRYTSNYVIKNAADLNEIKKFVLYFVNINSLIHFYFAIDISFQLLEDYLHTGELLTFKNLIRTFFIVANLILVQVQELNKAEATKTANLLIEKRMRRVRKV